MARLNLVKMDNRNQEHFMLQGDGDERLNADFSLFELDGAGGDPYSLPSGSNWSIVELPGIDGGIEYDPKDTDTFWAAQAQIIEAAVKAGIDIPDCAKN